MRVKAIHFDGMTIVDIDEKMEVQILYDGHGIQTWNGDNHEKIVAECRKIDEAFKEIMELNK